MAIIVCVIASTGFAAEDAKPKGTLIDLWPMLPGPRPMTWPAPRSMLR